MGTIRTEAATQLALPDDGPPPTARPDWQPAGDLAKRTYRKGRCPLCHGDVLWTPLHWWVCMVCGEAWQERVWKVRLEE